MSKKDSYPYILSNCELISINMNLGGKNGIRYLTSLFVTVSECKIFELIFFSSKK